MKPIPVAFHIGPLEVHTYGIGLAITFYVAYRYMEARLAKAGYETDWLVGSWMWIVAAAIVGARAMHVVANASYYASDPLQVFAVWHGGLSSFGGLLLGVPVGILLFRRRCPDLPTIQALDMVAPVLMAAWAIGRLLGPQLMVGGGGHPTKEWFGMYYAGEIGKRLPVPIFQAIECACIYAILLIIERRYPHRPTGFILATTMALWGLSRFLEEHLWLSDPSHAGSILVQAAGLSLFGAGLIVLGALWRRQRRKTRVLDTTPVRT
jgi:phosphatidylglycerol:prolipoprotein diacylglycerol transferase